MQKKYNVVLSHQDRMRLTDLERSSRTGEKAAVRARILLLTDAGYSDRKIARLLQIRASTVEGTRRRFCLRGLQAAVEARGYTGRIAKLSPEQKALLASLWHSLPPPNRRRWTLRLMCNKLVELGVVDQISHETVRRALKQVARRSIGQLRTHSQ